MGQQWHYAIGGQQHGPVTDAQLCQLANDGSLEPNDLVWKEGMKDWQEARSVKGLFPDVMATPRSSLPPPVPAKQPSISFVRRLMMPISVLFGAGSAAWKLAIRKLKRRWLVVITLPELSLPLGKDIYSTRRFHDDFQDAFQSLDIQKHEIEKLERTNPDAGDNATPEESKQRAAERSKVESSVRTLSTKMNKDFEKLGQLAWEKFGIKSGPKELTEPLHMACERQDILTEEIESLRAPFEGKVVTPKRFVIGVTLFVIFFLLPPAMRNAREAARRASATAAAQRLESERRDFQKQLESQRQATLKQTELPARQPPGQQPKNVSTISPREQLQAVDWSDLISASSLYAAFNGNEVAADAEFKGKVIFIDGEVVNVEKSAFSGVTINVANRPSLGSIGLCCTLSRGGARSEDLSKVIPGSWLNIRGKCEGKLPSGWVHMTGCDFILVNR
jgi:hypothetical protein